MLLLSNTEKGDYFEVTLRDILKFSKKPNKHENREKPARYGIFRRQRMNNYHTPQTDSYKYFIYSSPVYPPCCARSGVNLSCSDASVLNICGTEENPSLENLHFS
jgi:hypothetical protein